MKLIDEYKRTTNRKVYNRARKWYLEQSRQIHCSWCGYHRGENDTDKTYFYNKIINNKKPSKSYVRHRMPSWKLCTKNKKQWQEKKLVMNGKFAKHYTYNDTEQTYHWYSW